MTRYNPATHVLVAKTDIERLRKFARLVRNEGYLEIARWLRMWLREL